MAVKPWEGSFPAFQIWGNLYFVGTIPASTHIIDTGEGLIMLDSGYQHSLYLVLYNMYTLGLDPMNLKYILHTHGHIDHMGATKALVELTGAKTAIGRPDRDYVNGKLDLSWAKELGVPFDGPFEADILLKDGDEITLGNTTVRALATPGHTPGAMSYLFAVTDGQQKYVAGLHGGMGLNSMNREFLDKYGLGYDCRSQFLEAMDRIAGEKVDIYLGNHMQQNGTIEKYQRLLKGEKQAFVDPTEWSRSAQQAKESLLKMMKEEQESL